MEALNDRGPGTPATGRNAALHHPGSRARRLVLAGAVAAACVMAGGAGGYLVHGSNTAVSVIGTNAAPVTHDANTSHTSPDTLDQAATAPVAPGTNASHTAPDTLDHASTAPVTDGVNGSHTSPDTLDHVSSR